MVKLGSNVLIEGSTFHIIAKKGLQLASQCIKPHSSVRGFIAALKWRLSPENVGSIKFDEVQEVLGDSLVGLYANWFGVIAFQHFIHRNNLFVKLFYVSQSSEGRICIQSCGQVGNF